MKREPSGALIPARTANYSRNVWLGKACFPGWASDCWVAYRHVANRPEAVIRDTSNVVVSGADWRPLPRRIDLHQCIECDELGFTNRPGAGVHET